ncbi:HEAT repeat domain-containing protein [Myxococcus qinghaiensis]|uniref:HEAT repeat domain-containing protein n=1 Tax=Myxococcus qinghaiensis TaxID=2906758 RepID=UPI0020A817CB|nr:HEAT repeat domain-containing protein [Myxococcus qinghaiensis]MCP3162155.1 HEAT repeat domain-containing protein [Myxococcus qinghaiensis]
MVLFFPVPRAEAAEPPELKTLVTRLQQVAADTMVTEEDGLAVRIQAHGPAAIPALLSLLSNESKSVRQSAGYVLGDIEGLSEEHLEVLLRAQLRDGGFLSQAIGRIGTARAIDFLIAGLRNAPESNWHLTNGLVVAGSKAAVALAETVRAPAPQPPSFIDRACEVLRTMQAGSADAVAPLLAVATGSTTRHENKGHAIRLLGCVGVLARPAIPTLDALQQKDGTLRDAVGAAIADLQPPPEVAELISRLREEPSFRTLRELSERQKQGLDAGSAVFELLSSKDWELRAFAAQTLGHIQYAQAIPSLVDMLEDDEDWQRVLASVDALGRLHAVNAMSPLKRVAQRHWYPPVRLAARKALSLIRDKTSPAIGFGTPVAFVTDGVLFFAPRSPTPALVAGPDELSASELERLEYDAVIRGFGPDGVHLTPIKQKPDCGLRVPRGQLLGSDRGEWEGELMHVQDDATTTRVLDVNTHRIHRLGEHIIAVTGLAHLILNEGVLFRVIPQGQSFVARPWRTLPGAPLKSGLLSNGRLFISCLGGDVVVDPLGGIQMATPQNVQSEGK